MIRQTFFHAYAFVRACIRTTARISLRSMLRVVVIIFSLTGTMTFAQQDTDGDGLLDLLDVEEFDPNLGGELRFSNDGIEDLDGANQLSKAINLYFYWNEISSVEVGDFEGLTNLQKLYLRRNQITHLDAGAFATLANLQLLDLSENQITHLEAGGFKGLTSLRELRLGDNPITSIAPGAFEGLTNLPSLGLSGQISHLEAGAFTGLTNLQWLDLSENQISHLEAGTFTGLTNLMSLRLFDAGDFGFGRVVEIDTPIHEVEDGAFEGLESLRYLTLAHSENEMNLRGAEFQSLQYVTWATVLPIRSLYLDDAELFRKFFGHLRTHADRGFARWAILR